jgi:DNA-binding NarL/FixJ family response regulator
MKIRIQLVDDHQIVTDGLVLILSEEPDMEVIHIAQNGEMALAQMTHQVPDVVLLDYSLGNQGADDTQNGLRVAEKMLDKFPEVRIMMLTMHDSAEVIAPCINAGVHGYMLKSEKNADFGAAIRQLYSEGYYFSPEVAKDLAINLRRNGQEELVISRREQEVLECLFRGSSTKEIAEELFISTHTVDSHRKSLIHKFEARNSVHLIYLALQKGYLRIAD